MKQRGTMLASRPGTRKLRIFGEHLFESRKIAVDNSVDRRFKLRHRRARLGQSFEMSCELRPACEAVLSSENELSLRQSAICARWVGSSQKFCDAPYTPFGEVVNLRRSVFASFFQRELDIETVELD